VAEAPDAAHQQAPLRINRNEHRRTFMSDTSNKNLKVECDLGCAECPRRTRKAVGHGAKFDAIS
jgi:hypothetical protein